MTHLMRSKKSKKKKLKKKLEKEMNKSCYYSSPSPWKYHLYINIPFKEYYVVLGGHEYDQLSL